MPRNRRPRARDEKRAEIIAAARELFAEASYNDVTLASIARAAGVTPTTIYWYFTDKDDLLVAVLDDLLATSLARYSELADLDLPAKVMWVVDELRGISGLVDTVHTRRLTSTTIDAWHTGFHTLSDALVRAELPSDMPTNDAEAACRICTFVVEGLLSHQYDHSTARAVVDTLVRMLDHGNNSFASRKSGPEPASNVTATA